VHEHAFGLTSTPKAELFCRCKRRKFIGQNKVKICKLYGQNCKFLGPKIGCPSYNLCVRCEDMCTIYRTATSCTNCLCKDCLFPKCARE